MNSEKIKLVGGIYSKEKSVQFESIAKNCTFELKKTDKDIENYHPDAEEPHEMRPQKSCRDIDSPEWRKHIHTDAKSFFY